MKIAWANTESVRVGCLGDDLNEFDGVAGSEGEAEDTHDRMGDMFSHDEGNDVASGLTTGR